ncbi:MAG: galactose-1-phosphate uridylyltransferase [candidate division WOR-3 bacterium]
MSELRKDPVTGRWVILSAERMARPSDFRRISEPVLEAKPCPFDPGNESMTPAEILAFRSSSGAPNTSGWSVRVVPNRYPALTIEQLLRRRGDGVYDRMTGFGAHEVIIETPEHELEFADFGQAVVREVLRVYVLRVTDLARDERFRYALIFKNHGAAAGASLRHSHSQLIATPVVPKLVNEELAGCRQYWDFHERCIFCDMVRQELEDRRRLVAVNEHFLVGEPFAPRFPFETWVVARRHFAALWDMTDAEHDSLAATLLDVLGRINRVLERPAYNLVLHVAPLRTANLEYYHFHIEIMPKKTTVAGFEWGTGFFINPLSPEQAAEYLGEAA